MNWSLILSIGIPIILVIWIASYVLKTYNRLVNLRMDADRQTSHVQVHLKKKFDLILVDLYVGDEFPKKFETKNYIQRIRSVLAHNGIAIFNRLYYGEKRSQAMRFGNKLEKMFKNVEYFYPEANLMFICST